MNKRYLFIFTSICTVSLFFLLCSDTFAQEGISSGRRLWNSIMIWVNFGILVFLFIKFARKPLMDFLHGERNKITKKIENIEGQVKKARSVMEAEADRLKKIDENIEEIRGRIVELGQNEKKMMIEKADLMAKQMIEDAKKEAFYKLETAKKRLGEEMLEIAVSLTVEELKKTISQDDDEKIINQFSDGLQYQKGHFA